MGIDANELPFRRPRKLTTKRLDDLTKDKSPFERNTLTLREDQGNLVISFLALFVAIAASQVWGILAFIIHQLLASPRTKDTPRHHVQIALRNSASPIDLLVDIIKISLAYGFASRRLHQGRYARAFRYSPLLFIVLLVLVIFAAATVYSSSLFLAGNQVLIGGNQCGWPVPPGTLSLGRLFTTEAIGIASTYMLSHEHTLREAAETSEACYGPSGIHASRQCGRTIVPSLHGRVEEVDECPWQDLCLENAIRFDTGLVDSLQDLGINTKLADTVRVRQTLTCGPVNLTRYATPWIPVPEGQDTAPGDNVMAYQIGNIKILDIPDFPSPENTVTVANSSIWDTSAQRLLYQL